jgi:hypothetical protein
VLVRLRLPQHAISTAINSASTDDAEDRDLVGIVKHYPRPACINDDVSIRTEPERGDAQPADRAIARTEIRQRSATPRHDRPVDAGAPASPGGIKTSGTAASGREEQRLDLADDSVRRPDAEAVAVGEDAMSYRFDM